jgi:oligopeptide transport system substrate-binding protein
MRAWVALVLIAGLFCLSGCSPLAGAPSAAQDASMRAERVFRMNLATEPPNLDPVKCTDLTSFIVVLNTMRGLTRFDATDRPVPAIAERWTVSPDGRRYVFHLRRNARWSDGKPVTARDFVYNWRRALEPDTGAEYAFFLFDIENAKAFYDGQIKDFSQVGVHAPDDWTLDVRLARPVAYFAGLLASPVAMPARQDLVAAGGEKRFLVSNGPYTIARWRHDQSLTLKPNPVYFGPKPQVDRVEMLMVNDTNTSVVMYENNELDYIESPSSISGQDIRRLRKRPDAHSRAINAIYYFGFNVQKPPFDQPKVRQAFAYALDRRYFPKLLQSGQKPLSSFIPPGLLGYNPNAGIDFDPVKAKQLLAEAGYPDGKAFPTVELAFQSRYDIRKEAEIAQFLWKKNLNVPVRLRSLDWKVFLSQLKNDPPALFRLNWYADYPDADSFMGLFLSTNGNNYTGWKSADYDALVTQAAVTLDPRERQRLYDRAQALLLQEQTVVLPSFISEKLYLVKPHVHGVTVNGLNLLQLDHLAVDPPRTATR